MFRRVGENRLYLRNRQEEIGRDLRFVNSCFPILYNVVDRHARGFQYRAATLNAGLYFDKRAIGPIHKNSRTPASILAEFCKKATAPPRPTNLLYPDRLEAALVDAGNLELDVHRIGRANRDAGLQPAKLHMPSASERNGSSVEGSKVGDHLNYFYFAALAQTDPIA
jgi:hypothetical protein